jgi:predicted NAD/FAD-binding protein
LFKLFIFAKQMKNIKKIIGSGFSALAASAYLAQSGYDVTVFEKNDDGGRARQLKPGLPLIWDQVGTGCQTF